MNILTMRSVSFSYDRSDKTIVDNLSVSFAPGWTGLIGPNGCGKSTLLKLMSQELKPTAGEITGLKGLSSYCRQETTLPPSELESFSKAHDKTALSLKASLHLHELSPSCWENLSAGEQKRFQLACALWKNPDLLFVDEPTNHLDRKNRAFIISALKKFKGIGVLVSHDRELLNALCKHCVFFLGEEIHWLAGNYTEAKQNLDAKFEHFKKQRDIIKDKSSSLQKEVTRLNQLNQNSKKRLSKSKISRKDHDAKAKIDGARLTGKDASFGQKKLNLETRIESLGKDINSLKFVKDYSGSIFFEGEERVSKVILHCSMNEFLLPTGNALRLPELLLRSGSKIGLVGLNGVGKSSLIKYFLENNCVKTTNTFYLKQELSRSEIQDIRTQLSSLKNEESSRCLQIVGRLGSDPTQILNSEDWSSGEARKAALALAIVGRANFLILDEPTNHLDLPSIQNLEQALCESSLALLIVSHDQNFINTVCGEIWEIEKRKDGNSELKLNL